jgi:hypothetical protein
MVDAPLRKWGHKGLQRHKSSPSCLDEPASTPTLGLRG